MNKKQYNKLSHMDEEASLISVTDLIDRRDRTLIYGYTLDRYTFHVYLKGGKIHRYIYSEYVNVEGYDEYICGAGLPVKSVIPDKRIYPAKSDYEFCKILMKGGEFLSFTTFENENDDQYKGQIK